MEHLTDFQLMEYLSGDAGLLRRFLCRRHLRRCPKCAEQAKVLRDELEAQRSLGTELKSVQKLAKEADKTMTMPKAPALSKDN